MSKEHGSANSCSVGVRRSRTPVHAQIPPGSQQGRQVLKGSRRMGLARGLQPTSEQLKVPYEPTPAHHLGLGEQQHGGKGTEQSLLLQVSLAHWSWTLALFAFRDRCYERRENILVVVG